MDESHPSLSDEEASLSDEKLIEMNREGKLSADRLVSVLFDRYGKFLLRLGRKMGLREGEAEDVAQDTFVSLLNRLDVFDQKRNFRGWLYNLYRRKAIDYQQSGVGHRTNLKMTGEDPLPENELDNLPDKRLDTLALLAERETYKTLRDVLDELPAELRELIFLSYSEEMSASQIAALTNSSPDAVRKKLQRARKLVLAFLRERNIALEDLR